MIPLPEFLPSSTSTCQKTLKSTKGSPLLLCGPEGTLRLAGQCSLPSEPCRRRDIWFLGSMSASKSGLLRLLKSQCNFMNRRLENAVLAFAFFL